MHFEIKDHGTVFFRYGIWLCAFAMLTAIGVYAYLGSFSRYLSDDYCEAVRVTKSSPLGAVIERYSAGDWRAANRYSNLLFVGFSERLGPQRMPITMGSMVVLWAIGLSWTVHEFRKFFKVDGSIQMDIFLGATLGFFILLQAPNLYQTIYWRSSMMTHFAPVVFGSFLAAFWMKQARYALDRSLSLPIYLTLFFATFIIAGFSEPPVTTMVTALPLIMLAAWLWGDTSAKPRLLILLLWTFAGAFLGLMVMVFSPANLNMVQDSSPGLVGILGKSFLFSYSFVDNSIRTLPLPTILSVLIPAMLIWLYQQTKAAELIQPRKRILWIIIITAPFIMWILIAAGFAPSVYGQGFPVERMRFLARSIMTATLMFEGAMLGLLLQELQFKPNRAVGQWMVAVGLVVIGIIYPLRAALNTYHEKVPEYRARAEAWDERDAYIRSQVEQGETDLRIPQFDGVYGIKEIDYNENHWVNRCVETFYGVDSVIAISVKP